MLQYIIQAVLFQLGFLLMYELLLKKETFFTINRLYLLVTPLISLLLPLLKIESLSALVPAESISALSQVLLPEVYIGGQPENIQQLPAVNVVQEQGLQINWWLVTYVAGVILSLVLLLKKYQNLNHLFRFRRISEDKELRIIEVPNSKIACTFYKTVFLGDKLSEAEKQQILSHELVHVKQKHSLDLVFFEALKILFWFNPLVYIYQSRIAALHEFIADANVVQTTTKRSYYEQLLNTAFNTQNISFINQFFNHSLIKKRIIMLQKSRSKTIAKFKYLLVLPLLFIMLTYVSCSENREGIDDNQSISEQLAEIKMAIEDGKKLSDTEKQQLFEIVDAMVQNEKGSTPPSPPLPPFEKSAELGDNSKAVPFAVIEEVPVFAGCEDLSSNEERKDCMSRQISQFVNMNFNTNLGKELNLKGVNRIITQFRIDETGKVVDVKARASHPALQEEAIRVISEIPQMQPGKQDGKDISVMYSLPIVFQVGSSE
ncbi:Signal transducer regulating beta-lactamase production, contains metallopeptidase domain [Salegentibacter holothuriorum]|uniref:Signal transducer regulating beta-lactamase production, contains metallopeptidase domain n=1 Tax=Salegentibacter holothuriorum TaxID=241145 RepID=A0A1T5CJ42_9FLAO|nr:M56 family metallopeptidase [Salegentibacter holothuriorum]SKB59487.1 Signal transducer regulating beta-lactamase production, contains metallopeptidase domain [Salegentibacter holothuriorum]